MLAFVHLHGCANGGIAKHTPEELFATHEHLMATHEDLFRCAFGHAIFRARVQLLMNAGVTSPVCAVATRRQQEDVNQTTIRSFLKEDERLLHRETDETQRP